MISVILAALATATAVPSFDCAKATGVERLVCSEPILAALDARLADLYSRALKSAPGEAGATRGAQRAWLRRRDDTCAMAQDAAACLDGFYRRRIQDLDEQQLRREESVGHAPASAHYSDFAGRWQVVGVTVAEDAGGVTSFGTNEPRYMGLVMSAAPSELKWLNGTSENSTADVCRGPSFVPRSVATPLPSGWKAVTLSCKKAGYWTEWPVALTLKAQDLAELEWGGGALLHLKRIASNAAVPPPPRSTPPPPLPPDFQAQYVTEADQAFFHELQAAVRRGDRDWFANQGGVTVNLAPQYSYTYRPDEIRQVYDSIITPDVKRDVLASNADYALFKNWQGVMVKGGVVWFTQVWIDGRWVYRITAINHVPRITYEKQPPIVAPPYPPGK